MKVRPMQPSPSVAKLGPAGHNGYGIQKGVMSLGSSPTLATH